MAYQPAIPQATDQISISQGDLQGNFQEVNTGWNANHVPFNLGNEGSHWFISMPDQGAPSGTFPPATNLIGIYANEIGLYNSGGNLWFRPAGQAVGQIAPPGAASSDINLTDTTGIVANNGYTRLPNGLLLQWGKWASGVVPPVNQNPWQVTFATPFSAGTVPFSIMLTIRQGPPGTTQVAEIVEAGPLPYVTTNVSFWVVTKNLANALEPAAGFYFAIGI